MAAARRRHNLAPHAARVYPISCSRLALRDRIDAVIAWVPPRDTRPARVRRRAVIYRVPIPLDSDRLRSRLLEAASALFLERGYAGTSTLAIATRAHVSKRD
ncbi:MAG: helix-turn-helix transcriptional regulator, partial [Rhodospirillales bacterium]|nr:helix-turn-helix transcriptional regulator [Rhodospirillales bacterium]